MSDKSLFLQPQPDSKESPMDDLENDCPPFRLADTVPPVPASAAELKACVDALSLKNEYLIVHARLLKGAEKLIGNTPDAVKWFLKNAGLSDAGAARGVAQYKASAALFEAEGEGALPWDYPTRSALLSKSVTMKELFDEEANRPTREALVFLEGLLSEYFGESEPNGLVTALADSKALKKTGLDPYFAFVIAAVATGYVPTAIIQVGQALVQAVKEKKTHVKVKVDAPLDDFPYDEKLIRSFNDELRPHLSVNDQILLGKSLAAVTNCWTELVKHPELLDRARRAVGLSDMEKQAAVMLCKIFARLGADLLSHAAEKGVLMPSFVTDKTGADLESLCRTDADRLEKGLNACKSEHAANTRGSLGEIYTTVKMLETLEAETLRDFETTVLSDSELEALPRYWMTMKFLGKAIIDHDTLFPPR